MVVTTTRNPHVVAARRLKQRAVRRAEGRFLVEGPGPVAEALAYGGLVDLFVTQAAAERHADLVSRAYAVHVVADHVLRALADTVTPQGLVGVAPVRHVALESVPEPRLVAVLAEVQDPGNAGTVLRTADAAGADTVVFTAESVDPYGPKCVRASAGSLFHVRLVVGGTVAANVAALRERGLRVLATTPDAGTSLDDVDLSGPTAWLFGNEARGLAGDALPLADERVRIPIYGKAESLNLAAAAALCLYASARARR